MYFFVYVLVFFRLRPVIKTFTDFRTRIARIAPRLEVIGTLLGTESQRMPKAGAIKFSGLQKEIRFSKVGFRYPGSTADVVEDLSFSIEKGSTVALVGSSGAGKSTITDKLNKITKTKNFVIKKYL